MATILLFLKLNDSSYFILIVLFKTFVQGRTTACNYLIEYLYFCSMLFTLFWHWILVKHTFDYTVSTNFLSAQLVILINSTQRLW